MISIKQIFGRKPDPSTDHLEEADQKMRKRKEFIFPPVDENGRIIDDRAKMKDLKD
jgi:hypothetical protein